MSQTSSDRAVRKALLQAHAEIERIEVAQRVAHVREVITPSALLHRILPFSSGGRRQSHSDGSGLAVQSLFSQVGNIYERYPVVWSAVASLLLGRSRKLGRLFKLLGVALAVRKAMGGRRRAYRPH